MHSETKIFTDFVDFLKATNVLNASEVEGALAFLDGIEGVLSERTYILGYQGLAFCINEKLSLAELQEFALSNGEILAQDGDARYFFAQALMEKKSLNEAERVKLIHLMPESYQPFLLRRFVGS